MVAQLGPAFQAVVIEVLHEVVMKLQIIGKTQEGDVLICELAMGKLNVLIQRLLVLLTIDVAWLAIFHRGQVDAASSRMAELVKWMFLNGIDQEAGKSAETSSA